MAVGFDILGHPLEAPGDRVTVRRIDEPVVRLEAITGVVKDLPFEPEANTATAGLLRLRQDFNLAMGFAVSLDKGIPLGSGLAGSAASAVAAIVAAEGLLQEPLTPPQRYRYALIGETVASGSEQADNIAPCLNGGLTLVDAVGCGVRSIPVPDAIRCAVACPDFVLETRAARQVLKEPFSLDVCVRQSAHLASFLTGCFTGDLELIRASLEDLLVEPRRAALVPGFTRVKQAALDHHALGCSLSGSGPAVFAWCPDETTARKCASAMAEAFVDAGLSANTLVSRVNVPGAHIVA